MTEVLDFLGLIPVSLPLALFTHLSLSLSSLVLVSTHSQGGSFALPANGLEVTQVNLFPGYWHRESGPPEKRRSLCHVEGTD